jgi:osmotically inducible protein OsmC
MKRKALAVWEGGLKDGHGALTTESNILSKTPYSFASRFGEDKATNPEELIAAAHAGCFTMALSAKLEKEGFKAVHLETTAVVVLEQKDNIFAIPTIHLSLNACVANIDDTTFHRIAMDAKNNCPVSKLFNAQIELNMTLEN